MESIVKQVSTSTSLIIARFLSKNIHSVISPLDTCILGFLVICCSYVLGRNYQMSILSRRLALLLVVQTIQPMLMQTISSDVQIQTVMVNVGVISVITIIPFGMSNEVEHLISSVMYLYSDTLNFLLQWKEEQLSVATALVLAFHLNTVYVTQPRLQMIVSVSIVTTLSAIVQNSDDQCIDTSILRYSLLLIVLHIVADDSIHEVEATLLYAYVAFVESTLPNEPFITTFVAFALSMACKQFIGLHAWPTKACILISTNIFVNSAVQYIQSLAVFDTIITLKTSALMIQYFTQTCTKISLLQSSK